MLHPSSYVVSVNLKCDLCFMMGSLMKLITIKLPLLEDVLFSCVFKESSLPMHQPMVFLRRPLLSGLTADQDAFQVQAVTSSGNVPPQLQIGRKKSFQGTTGMLPRLNCCQCCLLKQDTILRESLNYLSFVIFDLLFIIILFIRAF